ncbi:MAG: alpha/beta fold hydrolase [Pseudomonadota bacterium]
MRILSFLMLAYSLAACAGSGVQETAIDDFPSATIHRTFVDGSFGQVHVRIAKPLDDASSRPPLLLLHPSPYSSAFFIDFMNAMSEDRLVIAVDTPGFGDSDRPDTPPSMTEYAANALIVLDQLDVQQPVDVLGYHTGTLIAIEMAIEAPERVHRLVLPGVPYFTGEAQQQAFDSYARPDLLEVSGAHFQGKWAFASGGLKYGMSLERAQAHFSDLVQAMPHSGHAYYGVFTYPGEAQLPKLTQPSLFIAPTGSLLAETQAAQAITPNSELRILSEYPHNVFDLGVPLMVELTREFLDR